MLCFGVCSGQCVTQWDCEMLMVLHPLCLMVEEQEVAASSCHGVLTKPQGLAMTATNSIDCMPGVHALKKSPLRLSCACMPRMSHCNKACHMP